MCYIILIVAFFIFYQQNPVYAIVIIMIFAVGFLFIRSRKGRPNSGFLGFLKGKQDYQNNHMNDLITIMMLQQLIGDSHPKEREIERNIDRDLIEEKRREIMELFDE